MKKKYIVSLNQGTTNSKCVIFDKDQNIVSKAQNDFKQIYPKPGWVEHDAIDIYVSQYGALIEAIAKADINPDEIAGIGIANQRETTIIWDKNTGAPIYNAIVWQCRRTAGICEKLLKDRELSDYIKNNTGLRIDAYFSATKIKWVLDNVEGARKKAESGDLLFGTVDSWLVYKLTGGRVHVTDYSNASRTMLFNIRTLEWDRKILRALEIPESILPKVRNSSEIYGCVNISGIGVPICGMAGDQQAALFGQTCFDRGDIKNTYDIGNFILMNTGHSIMKSRNGLLTTIAYGLDDKITYALEGSVFVGSSVLQWLKDKMMFFSEISEADDFVSKNQSSRGVYFVPAFSGLGTPHWDIHARGCIFGLIGGTSKEDIVRASLESIAFQSKDVIDAMMLDTRMDIKDIKVDGETSESDIVMQFQSDITGKILKRPVIKETTTLGAAYLAGLAVGFYDDLDEIREKWNVDKVYKPKMDRKERDKILKGWNNAVVCTKMWKE